MRHKQNPKPTFTFNPPGLRDLRYTALFAAPILLTIYPRAPCKKKICTPHDICSITVLVHCRSPVNPHLERQNYGIVLHFLSTEGKSSFTTSLPDDRTPNMGRNMKPARLRCYTAAAPQPCLTVCPLKGPRPPAGSRRQAPPDGCKHPGGAALS